MRSTVSLAAAVLAAGGGLVAQAGVPAAATVQAAALQGVAPPSDYVIGTDDVLNVVVWREQVLSAEVMVRPDGMVSLPLMNDIRASGLTPEQFRQDVTRAASKFVEAPSVTVIVKTISVTPATCRPVVRR